ncbi:MoaD/ThiS family protein [Chitinibacteraceae bacterium HSL-7]
MRIELLFFARFKDLFGAGETLNLPDTVVTVADVVAHLIERGGVWHDELSGARPFRAAVDQEMAKLATELHDGAELALFPPVTGG